MCEQRNKNEYTLKRLLSEYDFVVPVYQRNYAQGRANPRDSQVLDLFISEISNVLTCENGSLSMDYVYGDIQEVNGNKVLRPIDGQQRLTTLFLFHVFCYQGCEKEKKDFLLKFNYETRSIASTLIAELLKDGFHEPAADKGDEWDRWLNLMADISKDPTASAMLRAYRKIESKLGKLSKSKEVRDRLDNITFQVVDGKEHKLPDSIFWKMNARGRQLTPAELFKASFFSDDADSAYAFDECISRIFKAYFKESHDLAQCEKLVMYIVNIMFEGFSILDDDNGRPVFINGTFISKDCYLAYKEKHKDEFRAVLDLIRDGSVFTGFYESLPGYVRAEKGWKHEEGVFKAFRTQDFNWKHRMLFFLYLLTASKLESAALKDRDRVDENLFFYMIMASNLESAALKDHVRVYANLLWNTTEKCKEEDVVRNIYIHKLYETDDFLSKLAGCNDIKSLGGQYREECEKAEWIDTHPDYKADIIRAESTAFADGCISFLYKGGRGWEDFRTRLKNFSTWFDKDGVKNEYCESIVRAYIKLTPWDWSDSYFNTSKENWYVRIFKGMIYDKDYQKEYEDITVGLLSCTSLEAIEEKTSDSAPWFNSFKQSLLSDENAWFAKWMLSHSHQECLIDPKGYSYIFHRRGLWIYWDKEGNENATVHCSTIQSFFREAMNRHIKLKSGYYKIVDDNGNELDDTLYESGDIEKYHLIVIVPCWYNGCNIEFVYKKHDFWMSSDGIIYMDWNESKQWFSPEEMENRSIYSSTCTQKSLDEIVGQLDAMIGSSSETSAEE